MNKRLQNKVFLRGVQDKPVHILSACSADLQLLKKICQGPQINDWQFRAPGSTLNFLPLCEEGIISGGWRSQILKSLWEPTQPTKTLQQFYTFYPASFKIFTSEHRPKNPHMQKASSPMLSGTTTVIWESGWGKMGSGELRNDLASQSEWSAWLTIWTLSRT